MKPERREAAVAVILAPARDPAVLMVQRAVRVGDHWSGQIGLPGGGREPGDADLLATAVRETIEETGIDLSSARTLGRLGDVRPKSPDAPLVVVSPFVFGLPARPEVAVSEEVTGHFWFPVRQLVAGEAVVPLIGKPVAAYRLGANVVWGLTFRVLEQLVEAAPWRA